jgi:NhaP-type Na+/H+ or K+/H+ antiporter
MAQLKDKDLTSVIFGEAIFNDATAIALFTVLQPVALSPYDLSAAGEETEAGQPAIVDQQSGWGMACQFVYVSFGSLAAGVLCGALSALITKHASSIGDKGPHVEVAVVITHTNSIRTRIPVGIIGCF